MSGSHSPIKRWILSFGIIKYCPTFLILSICCSFSFFYGKCLQPSGLCKTFPDSLRLPLSHLLSSCPYSQFLKTLRTALLQDKARAIFMCLVCGKLLILCIQRALSLSLGTLRNVVTHWGCWLIVTFIHSLLSSSSLRLILFYQSKV